MTGMLASVNCLNEALLVLEAEADIIDLKQPTQGALGALELDTVTVIVDHIAKQRPVSATIGDLPMHPDTVFTATQAMAATGVDYIKIGFFPGGDWHGTLDKLSELARSNVRLIAVLFADQQPEFEWIATLADHGFTGTMLDTMDKHKGSLTSLMELQKIDRFIGLARDHELICGLAGSLSIDDIDLLLPFHPDYLGFRGALCSSGSRTSALNQDAVITLKQTLSPTTPLNPVNTHVKETIDHL